jgi:outer membrane protein OmpA-like peptidoglycan-associated protein/tetratricopeptide (TPR) repeat protein
MIKKRLLICFIFLLGYTTFAQDQGELNYAEYHFKTNIKRYEKELDKNPTNNEVRHRLATALYKVGNTSAAYTNYKQLFLNDFTRFTPDDWNNFAHLSLAFGNVVDATKAFDKLFYYNSAFRFQKKPVEKECYFSENMERLNTIYSEFSPIFRDNKLVFSSDKPISHYDHNHSDWTGTPYLSLFEFDSTKTNPVHLFSKELNETFHVGPASFSTDGKTIYYTRAFKDDKKGINTTKIYLATFEKGKWRNQTPFEFATDKSISYAHPVYLQELNMLVFSANLHDSKGEMDLYFSINDNGTWSSPINLGENINTPFNEVFPCANPYEPTTLYFSSNGYLGFGGLDIYSSSYTSGKWSTPVLLPKSINSNFDDFGITFTAKEQGFVSSNRRGGKGGDDIYFFKKTGFIALEGILVDAKKNNLLINKKLFLQDEFGQLVDSVQTDSKGYFVFSKLPYQNYGIRPDEENGAEMVIRPLTTNLPKDPFVNLQLMTSGKVKFDSISLLQNEVVTFVLESADAIKRRCVVYENGDKAVFVSFNVKDKKGQTIDCITTDEQGCLVMKKLYNEDTYLELIDELQVELKMRFVKSTDEKNTNWINEKLDLELTSLKRCVIYEDGAEAVQINFAVKDSTGAIIDLITTDEKGCFQIRKLYNQKTYLDLIEDRLAEMGLKFMKDTDNKNFEWYKQTDQIILKSPLRCVIYQNGQKARLVQMEVKDNEGETMDVVKTDEEGCFKIRKLYGINSYLEILDDQDAIMRTRITTDSKDGVLLLEKTELLGENKMTAKIYDYKNLNKDFTGLKIVFYSEGGLVKKVAAVNKLGEFDYEKLSSKSSVLMMIEDKDGTLVGTTNLVIKGMVSPAKQFINTNNNTFYIVDADREKFSFSKLKSTGEFEFKINLEDYDLASRTKEIKSFEEVGLSKENQVVVKNIYFESGKWNLDVDAEKVMDELVLLLRKNPNLSVHIKAHTDSKGSATDNLRLSNNRAGSVATYLSLKGISSSQFSTKGYGESLLLNQCKDNIVCTEEEHAQNRRIEFEFVWK